jgi:AcrR family transcriptional regulator
MPRPVPPPFPSSSDGRRAQRQLAIIETAAELFAQHGYADCEVDRIAQAAELAKGTIYLYFPSKEELFLACVDLAMREMQRTVHEAADQVEEPFAKIAAAIRSYLVFFDKHPQYVELLIQERAIFRNRKRPKYFDYRDAGRPRWRQMYLDLMAKGLLRNDMPVERLMDTLGALLYGTMYTNHFIGRSVTLDEQFQAILRIALHGIAPGTSVSLTWSDSPKKSPHRGRKNRRMASGRRSQKQTALQKR